MRMKTKKCSRYVLFVNLIKVFLSSMHLISLSTFARVLRPCTNLAAGKNAKLI
jgi:hypothetical protein